MDNAHERLIRSLRAHSRLAGEDIRQIAALPHQVRQIEPNEDFIHQGDIPRLCALVVSGVVGRFHLLHDGRRQYLSFHLAGNLPDAQGLFLRQMDHGLCAIGPATVAFFGHTALKRAFDRRPLFAFAIWRETLIDAAIFREAITNNSARTMAARMAHLFCELFYRAKQAGLNDGAAWDFPISLPQLGEALGMAIATVHRTLQELRATAAVDFRDGKLIIPDWAHLAEIGEFDPGYLHSKS